MRSLDGKSRAAVDGSTNPGQTRGPNAEFSPMSDALSVLDASGLRCPEPLMLLRQRMRQLAPGDRLQVLTTDPASVRDFEQFSRFVGHPILEQEETDGVLTFLFECAPR